MYSIRIKYCIHKYNNTVADNTIELFLWMCNPFRKCRHATVINLNMIYNIPLETHVRKKCSSRTFSCRLIVCLSQLSRLSINFLITSEETAVLFFWFDLCYPSWRAENKNSITFNLNLITLNVKYHYDQYKAFKIHDCFSHS